ncbi:hypothetical protein KC19_VG126200 [Ceratodon purpureus]|uniref:Uncharacterized protein n=1 Tax=Ceratodon purpureus TaxID=3225 RepID=A0A8T0HPE2_CERPU|nr:hypothetical protein KC19_VG126200 [Ceratodon purpureus]
MQLLNASIPRVKSFTSRKEMSKGGGLPLCLAGVSILAQVPQNKAKLSSASTRCRSSSSRGSSAARNLDVLAALDFNDAESRSRSCDTAERRCEDLTMVLLGPCDREAIVHRPRVAVAQKMAELDRRRESLRKRRLVQGLGSFLEEQAFMQSRAPQGCIRPLWMELVSAELYCSNPRHDWVARAA